MSNNQQPRNLLIIIILAILAVSTASLFIKFAQQEAPFLVIAAIRMVLASLFLLPITLSRFRADLISFKLKELILAIISGIFLAFHFAAWIASLKFTSVANSVVFVSTGPIWVALFSIIILKEKTTKSFILGMSITLAGAFFIAIDESCRWQGTLICSPLTAFLQFKSVTGDLLALLGALMVSGYLLIGRRLRTTIPLIPYIFVVYSIASLVLVIMMFIASQTPFGYSFQTYFWLLMLALVPQILGHSTYNWSLKFLPASTVAITTLGEPIGATLLAYFFLKETPGILKIAGALIILAGIYITVRRQPNTN